jgi:hypothetical protein
MNIPPTLPDEVRTENPNPRWRINHLFTAVDKGWKNPAFEPRETTKT